MLVIDINSGEEVLEKTEHEIRLAGITNAAIASVIGAVASCTISNMPKENALKDILNDYEEPFELSGCGEVRDGKPHIHCVVSRSGEESLAGHLHRAVVGDWYVRVYVIPE